MMNWPQFLTQHNINYVTSGPNVGRENIGINCPYCSDPSEHLNISLEGKGWICFRCKNGGGAAALIHKLLGCSWEEAREIAGVRPPIISVSDHTFGEYINNMMKGGEMAGEQEKRAGIDFMIGMNPLTNRSGSGIFAVNYLCQRGYSLNDSLALSRRYKLKYTMTGPFKYRIIIPVFDELGHLLTWTGRAITNSNLRYKDLTADADKAKKQSVPQAVCPIKHTLLNIDQFVGGEYKALYIVEGPLDALRIDYFMRNHSVRATCTFGNSLSDEQGVLLQRIAGNFRHMFHTFDPDSEMRMPGIASKLAHLNIKSKRYPSSTDAAEMSPTEIEEWVG